MHPFRAEDAFIHDLQVLCHFWTEVHLCQNVLFQIHARRDLGQHHTVLGQPEHRALCDIHDGLLLFRCILRTEGDLLDRRDEFVDASFLLDHKPAILNGGFQPACGKRAAEHHFLCGLGNINESAADP